MNTFKTIGIALVVIGLLILGSAFVFIDASSLAPVLTSSVPLFGLAAILISRKNPKPKE